MTSTRPLYTLSSRVQIWNPPYPFVQTLKIPPTHPSRLWDPLSYRPFMRALFGKKSVSCLFKYKQAPRKRGKVALGLWLRSKKTRKIFTHSLTNRITSWAFYRAVKFIPQSISILLIKKHWRHCFHERFISVWGSIRRLLSLCDLRGGGYIFFLETRFLTGCWFCCSKKFYWFYTEYW